jgi:hypothetical protein
LNESAHANAYREKLKDLKPLSFAGKLPHHGGIAAAALPDRGSRKSCKTVA